MPQLLRLVLVLTHSLPQSVRLEGHSCSHTPPTHCAVPPSVKHGLPHAPQWSVLVLRLASQPSSVRFRLQLAKPELHMPLHTPRSHAELATLGSEEHALPHAPQCTLLVCRLVHTVLPGVHRAPGSGHVSVQTPALHDRPKQQGDVAEQLAASGRQHEPGGVSAVAVTGGTQTLPPQHTALFMQLSGRPLASTPVADQQGAHDVCAMLLMLPHRCPQGQVESSAQLRRQNPATHENPSSHWTTLVPPPCTWHGAPSCARRRQNAVPAGCRGS